MKPMLVIFILAVVFASCGKKCPCQDETILPIFVGYDTSQVNPIKIIRFDKGSNFTRAIDSAELTSANTMINTSGNAISLLTRDTDARIGVGYDWQVINPFDNRTVNISEITLQKTEGSCGGSLFGWDRQACVSPITSFKVNGSAYAIDHSFGNSGVVIRK